MKAVVKPIALGIVTYFVTAIGVWFFLSNVLYAVFAEAAGLLIGAVVLVPLIVSGYVGARFTVSGYRARRVWFGVASALAGYATSYFFVDVRGEAWMLIVVFLGAAIVAAVGAWLGSIGPPREALWRTPDT